MTSWPKLDPHRPRTNSSVELANAVQPQLSVVVPVYRSAASLPQLTQQLLKVLHGTKRSFEIIFVDDGSPDDSWRALRELQAKYPNYISIIELMRNFGQHNALMCGLRRARGELIITMDDDLQHPPEEIPKLVAAIEETGMDLMYGTAETKQHHPMRNVASALVIAFFKFAFQCQIQGTSFRAMRRELVQSIFTYNLNFTYIDGLLAWNTQRIGTVRVAHHPATSGASRYSLRKLIIMAVNLLTNFSLIPLQVASACGVLAASGGFVLGAYYLFQYLSSNITVPGYASTMIVMLVLGGIQLLSLGIIGEYLGRLHINVNRKPQYVERHVILADSCENDPPSSGRSANERAPQV